MDITNSNNFSDKIARLTNQYYSENKKKTFFKNDQKKNFASSITNSIGFDELISNTFYIIPNTQSIFIDYTVFKLYTIPEYYNEVVIYISSLIDQCICKYGNFNVHINIDTFTMSAAERYKHVISIFLNKCISTNSGYCLKLHKMFIYNTPNTFQTISKMLMPLIDNEVKSKIVLYDKNDSEEFLKILKG